MATIQVRYQQLLAERRAAQRQLDRTAASFAWLEEALTAAQRFEILETVEATEVIALERTPA